MRIPGDWIKETDDLVSKGNLFGARQLVIEHLRQHPTDTRALLMLADLSVAVAMTQEALQAYEAATERYIADRELIKAIVVLGQILRVDAGHVYARQTLDRLKKETRRPK